VRRFGATDFGKEDRVSRIIRAISIRQPYVEQILRGDKTREYRSRPTSIRERVYLYASLRPADADAAWAQVEAHPGDFPTGVIVGTVEIAGCRELAAGSYAYELRAPKRLRVPLTPTNQPQPSFWRPQF
jgi:hypothetical protein